MNGTQIMNFNIGNIGIKVSTDGFFHAGNKAGATVHTHTDFELHIVMSGAARAEIEGERLDLSDSEALVIFPNSFHRFLFVEGESSVLSFSFSIQRCARGYNYFDFVEDALSGGASFLILQNSRLRELVGGIIPCIYSESPFAKDELRSRFSLLFIRIFEELSIKPKRKERDYDNFEYDRRSYIIDEYFNEHYMEDISLSELSEKLSLSEKQAARIVFGLVGVGFREHLVKIRIKSSAEFLAESDMNIKEVAERVGYSSYNGFYSAFKKIMGITPEEYRLSRGNSEK